MSLCVSIDPRNVPAACYVTIDDHRGLERVLDSESAQEHATSAPSKALDDEDDYLSDDDNYEDAHHFEVRIELWKEDEHGDEFVAGGWLDVSGSDRTQRNETIPLLDTEGEQVTSLYVQISFPSVESKDAENDAEESSTPAVEDTPNDLNALIGDNLLHDICGPCPIAAVRALKILSKHVTASRGMQARIRKTLGPKGLRSILWQLERHEVERSRAIHKFVRNLVTDDSSCILHLARAADWPGVVTNTHFYYFVPHAVLREAFAETHHGDLHEEDYIEFATDFVRENAAHIAVPALPIPDEATAQSLRKVTSEKSTSIAFRLIKLFSTFQQLSAAGALPDQIAEDPFICAHVSLPIGARVQTWEDLRQRFYFQHYQLRNTSASALQEDIVLLENFACGIQGRAASVTIVNLRSQRKSRLRLLARVENAHLQSPMKNDQAGLPSQIPTALGLHETRYEAFTDLDDFLDPLNLSDAELVALAHRCAFTYPKEKDARVKGTGSGIFLLEPLQAAKSQRKRRKKPSFARQECPREAYRAAMPAIADLWNVGNRVAAGKRLVEYATPLIPHLKGQPGVRASLSDDIKRVRLRPQDALAILKLWHSCNAQTGTSRPEDELSSALTLVAELWNQGDREATGRLLVEKGTALLPQLERQPRLRTHLSDAIKRTRLKPKSARAVEALWRVCESVVREVRELESTNNQHHGNRHLARDIVLANRASQEAKLETQRVERTKKFERSLSQHRARESEKVRHQHRLVFEREQESRRLRKQREEEEAELARKEAAWYREEAHLREVERKLQRKELEREARRRAEAKKRNDQAIETQRKRLLEEERRVEREQERRRREYEARAKVRTQAAASSSRKVKRKKHYKLPQRLDVPREPSVPCRVCSPRAMQMARVDRKSPNLFDQVDWAAVCDWPDLPDTDP